MSNYLARLSWSHGDDEIMELDFMIQKFSLDGVGQSAARFNLDKLNHLNGHYIRAMPDDELLQHWKVCLKNNNDDRVVRNWMANRGNQRVLLSALPGLKQRAKTLVELADGASYSRKKRPLDMDTKAAKILAGDRSVLPGLYDHLSQCGNWTADNVQAVIQAYALARNLKLGKVAQPLRAALTGRTASLGIYDVLEHLGRDESLAHIQDQVQV